MEKIDVNISKDANHQGMSDLLNRYNNTFLGEETEVKRGKARKTSAAHLGNFKPDSCTSSRKDRIRERTNAPCSILLSSKRQFIAKAKN